MIWFLERKCRGNLSSAEVFTSWVYRYTYIAAELVQLEMKNAVEALQKQIDDLMAQASTTTHDDSVPREVWTNPAYHLVCCPQNPLCPTVWVRNFFLRGVHTDSVRIDHIFGHASVIQLHLRQIVSSASDVAHQVSESWLTVPHYAAGATLHQRLDCV